MRTTNRITILAVASCAAVAALVFAGPASAKIVDLHTYNGTYPTSGSIDGSGSVGAPAPFQPGFGQIQINQATNQLIVGSNAGGGRIYKFSLSGTPEPFSFVAPNTAIVYPFGFNGYGDLTVDNSGEAGGVDEGEQGRIFGFPENGPLHTYKASGEPYEPGGTNFPIQQNSLCAAGVAPDGDLWLGSWGGGSGLQQYNPSNGNTKSDGPAGGHINVSPGGPCAVEIDEDENFYVSTYGGEALTKWDSAGNLVETIESSALGEPSDIALDSSTGYVYTDHGSFINEYNPDGELTDTFGGPNPPFPGLSGSTSVTVDEDTGIVYATNENGTRVNTFVRTGPITVPDVTTNLPTVTATGATLKGVVDPDATNSGAPIDNCTFEWGLDTNYGNTVACDQALPINSNTAVTATIGGLAQGTTYHYRLTASNEDNHVTSFGLDRTFEPAGPPVISNEAVSDVNTDGVRISGKINPSGGFTKYRIEYGATTAYGNTQPVPDAELPNNLGVQSFSFALTGLSPGTTYHYRVSATNLNGTTNGDDHLFTTFPTNPTEPDPCPNAQVRQQTGASLLLDCRAYELASAGNTAGYDVQSTLVPGQVTLPPEPGAGDKVLYSVHFGAIPGTGQPTNFGLDPYVATRGSGGWSTSYVGIPASPSYSDEPFGSPLAGAGSSLGTLAFSGPSLCSPCFSDDSTGIPVHLSNGTLVQGMKGSLNPGPGAESSGLITKPVSDDGSHLVFGSTSKFEPAGNTGSLTVYDRNLSSGSTQVVSTLPNGSTMSGTPAELDISSNGSRILIGEPVSTDTAGNTYYDLFMHVGSSANSVAVADTASGVIFNGMTSDGSKVFFTTPDALTGDADTSADLYRADVGSTSAAVARVSTGTGGSGDTNTCNPVLGKNGTPWNSVSATANCGVVGIAGGGGVAPGNGTVYFLSPEKLDGGGTLNAPNLFVVEPGGSPHFVATLEPGAALVTNGTFSSEVHRYTDFQTTTDGDDAVLASNSALEEGVNTFGFTQIFRYDGSEDAVTCVSCASTGAAPTTNINLSEGLNLADDGSVYFTSPEALVLRDSNKINDVYEWKGGKQQLISTGISEFESGLLSVTTNAVNVFFFTRATLVPQDHNGETMKVYTARAGGGFLSIPPLPLCAAKDECHGPGTVAAPPPQIGTFKGTGGNAKRVKCKKPKVKRNGKCVKKPKKKKKKKKSQKRGNG